MRELLEFTREHCTDKTISDAVLLGDTVVISKPMPLASKVTELQDAVLRSELERAMANLTLDNVDMGLFLLGKILEDEIRKYLITARAKGTATITQGDLKSFSTMMQAAVKTGIVPVTKEHHLTLLREHRNERAHDEIPDEAERKRLLSYAPFLQDLYIEYIVLFNRERHKLEVRAD